MYCRKCKNLLPENEFICNHCKFDNFFESAYQDTLREKKNIKTNNQSSVFSVVVLFMLVCVGVIMIYSISETKAYEGEIPLTTNTIRVSVEKHTFKFFELEFSYPDTFGTSRNTIFYKKNTDININIKEILETEYNDLINSNDCLDSIINDINTKTYAGDNFYSYAFTNNKKFYELRVNYINDPYYYNEDIQLTISDIINSMKINNELK